MVTKSSRSFLDDIAGRWGEGMIYVAKTDVEGKINAIQGADADRKTVEELIQKNFDYGKGHWIILDGDLEKRIAAFYLEQQKKMSRKYDLDDLVKQLEEMESELYNFRRYVEDESKRIKDEPK